MIPVEKGGNDFEKQKKNRLQHHRYHHYQNGEAHHEMSMSDEDDSNSDSDSSGDSSDSSTTTYSRPSPVKKLAADLVLHLPSGKPNSKHPRKNSPGTKANGLRHNDNHKTSQPQPQPHLSPIPIGSCAEPKYDDRAIKVLHTTADATLSPARSHAGKPASQSPAISGKSNVVENGRSNAGALSVRIDADKDTVDYSRRFKVTALHIYVHLREFAYVIQSILQFVLVLVLHVYKFKNSFFPITMYCLSRVIWEGLQKKERKMVFA